MSLKEYLIKQVAKDMDIPLEIVHSIIAFQGEDAAKASHRYNEIEFSGWGKFIISKPRAKRSLSAVEKLLQKDLSPEKRAELEIFMQRLKNRIDGGH